MSCRLPLTGMLLVALGGVACSGAALPDSVEAGAPPTGNAKSAPTGNKPAAACPTTIAPGKGTVVTQTGAVTGVNTGGTWAWKGIPYAAPPVGSLRFRPPQPAACWSGERKASTFGPQCPQIDGSTQKVVGSEDCLTLNVWAKEGASGAPVLVFIHGGGNTQGSASDPEYDGSALAALTGSVVVTVEYRLGALGFLTATALSAESDHKVSGNYGILDQNAALSWVKANIAAFGGSPEHVMLFGESAGGQDTVVHLASPLSKGLFAAATIESGGSYKTTIAQSVTEMESVLQTLGCSGARDVASCLRGKTAEEIAAIPTALGPLQKGLHYEPVVDGYVLLENPVSAISSGAFNHVPVILGTNADETSRMVPKVTTDAEYQAAVKAQYSQLSSSTLDALLAHYPSSAYPSPEQALIALTTDATWTCPIRTLAREVAGHQSEPVFRYHFTWKSPGPGGALIGATHGMEIPFVFRTFSAIGSASFSPTQSDDTLSSDIEDYWSRMAAHGDPNGPGTPTWPRYDGSTDPYLGLDTTISAGEGLETTNCDFIDSVAP